MRRRAVLAAAALGASTLLAGCSDDDGGDDDGSGEPLDGNWELRGLVVNEDDEPREWRLESRSETGSAAAAHGTIPAGEEWELGLSGTLRDEQLEVYAESDGGATTAAWRPAECRRLAVEVTISGGNPRMELECRAEDGSDDGDGNESGDGEGGAE